MYKTKRKEKKKNEIKEKRGQAYIDLSQPSKTF